CKLMAGSWGTLAALTTVTVKTLPRPETQTTVLIIGLDDATAVRAMTAAMATPCDVSGAAHLPAGGPRRRPLRAGRGARPPARLPAGVAGRIHLGEGLGAGRSLTLLRLEGVAPSVAHRKSALTAAMKPFGEVQTSDDIVSRNFWRAIRDVMPFAASRGAAEPP